MNIKKSVSLLLMIFLISGLLAGCGGTEEKKEEVSNGNEVIKLKLHHHDPPTSDLAKTLESWAKEVETKANGKVEINIYPGSSLGAANAAFDMVSSGVADIGWSFVGFYPNKFPMTEAITLPMLGIDDGIVGSKAIWEMYTNTDYLKEEFKGVKVLALHTHLDVPIGTVDKKIETMEDMKGLKLRVPGGPPTEFTKQLGATPINIPPTDLYTSLEKGVLDGYMIDWSGVSAFKLSEVSQYVLDTQVYVAPFFIIMNENKWNSLPEDVKEVFEELSGAYLSEKISKEAYLRDKLLERISSDGASIYELDPAERAKWQEKADSVKEDWIKAQEEAGRPGKEVLEELMKTIEKVRSDLGYK